MSNGSENAGCIKGGFYIGLAVGGLWLLWQLLQFLYSAGCYLAINLFLGLDLSAYGRAGLGTWGGYALLGLGLGAAAGAVAAQQRYRLHRLIPIGAAVVALLLCSFVFLGNTASRATSAESVSSNLEDSQPTIVDSAAVNTDTTEVAVEKNTNQGDTATQAIDGWMQVASNRVALCPNREDSMHSSRVYLHSNDTVRLLRQAGNWVRVVVGGPGRQHAGIGWVRLNQLTQFADSEPESKPALSRANAAKKVAASPKMAQEERSLIEKSEPVTSSITWPTGHQQHTGQVGKQLVTYSLDWQPSGVVSGSYYYDNNSAAIYRLTGAASSTGELHLLEFTRGKQSANCVLQWQDDAYVGTMFNTDGREFSMSLQ